jgi:uncharacterized damage-inducible protein DinB
MKDYFIRLFNYDQFANETILTLIKATNYPEKPVQLMAHLLSAQQIWLGRCLQKPADVALWPEDGNTANFEALINDNHAAWIVFLNSCTTADFDQEISYSNSRGMHFNDKLADILGHVINHGTHHRAQIGQQIKIDTGTDLPMTDYIFYIRTQL